MPPARGARLSTGGKRIDRPGYFFAPTVLAKIADEARITSEEPFGPVAPITRLSDYDEVIERANGLPYGLVSLVFTRSLATASRAEPDLEPGLVDRQLKTFPARPSRWQRLAQLTPAAAWTKGFAGRPHVDGGLFAGPAYLSRRRLPKGMNPNQGHFAGYRHG